MLHQYGPICQVLQQLRATQPLVTMLQFFCDGPTTQYRNKDNFYFLSTETHALGFDAATWNFFESGHGKGAPDAIGGALKRTAECMLNAGCDMQDANKLYNVLCKESCVQIAYVSSEQVEAMDLLLPANLKPIPGTMKLHQLRTEDYVSLSYRNLSCLCTRPTPCSRYNAANKVFVRDHCQHPEPSE